MGRILLIALGVIVLYQLVFKLIIPAVRITQKMRSQVRDFNNKMQEEQQRYAQNQQNEGEKASGTSSSGKVGEYIDFEEIK